MTLFFSRGNRGALAGALLAGGLLAAPGAQAASCSVAVPAFTFPNYNALDYAPVDGFSSLTVNCLLSMGQQAETVNYQISLSTGSSGTYAARTFIGQPLQYNLYTDANHARVWGDGTAGTTTVSGSISLGGSASASAMHSVYGRVPPRQLNVVPGAVSDRIVVVIDY